MAKKTELKTYADVIRYSRKKNHEATMGMTDAQRHAYYRKQSAKGEKRLQAALDAYDALPEQEKIERSEQLLIRLSTAEKAILEQQAASEKAKSVSALVRSRSLLQESPFDAILTRLDSVVRRLDKIEKTLKTSKR